MSKYYNVKVKVTTEVVSKKGIAADKVITELYLVNAVSVTDAETKTHEYMKGTMLDFEVASAAETKVLAVVE